MGGSQVTQRCGWCRDILMSVSILTRALLDSQGDIGRSTALLASGLLRTRIRRTAIPMAAIIIYPRMYRLEQASRRELIFFLP